MSVTMPLPCFTASSSGSSCASSIIVSPQISLSEIIAGLVATATAAAVAIVVHRMRSRRLKLSSTLAARDSRPLARCCRMHGRSDVMLLSALPGIEPKVR